MRNKLVFGVLLSLLYSLTAMGQLRIVNRDKLDSKSSESKLNISQLISASQKSKQNADTLYFADIDFKNMWIIGSGDTLTKEDAIRRPIYYRFTMKNSKGNWQHVEAMSNGLPAKASVSVCIYDGINIGEVDEMLSSSLYEISQWFELSDLEGDELLEERSYDADGNLILTGLFHRLPDGRIIVSYNDSHGFPIDFLPDDNYTYGHVYALTLDGEGRSSNVEYLDGAGFARLGALGAYQHRIVRDEMGRVVERSYHNGAGNLMNNKFGYAKETTEYSPDGKRKISKHFDVDNNLVKSTAPYILGYMIEEIEFDDMGGIKSWKYFTIENGEKVNDEVNGVHCYVVESYNYNDNSSVYKTYDKNYNEIK